VAVYLDSNATTRIHPSVIEAMLPFLTEHWQNPSGSYRSARVVREAVEQARGDVATLIGARPEEIVFTAGGTEANNSALKALSREVGRTHSKIAVSAIEHSAVLRPVEAMAAVGFEVERVGVDEDSRLDLAAFHESIDDSRPGFASVMWANNETGVVQPLSEVCRIAKQAGWFVHTDAVAAVGKVPVRVDEVPVDYLSLSGHKFHAPKGVGALFIRGGSPFEPMVRGGGQESGRRGGTENVASIVGLGAAARLVGAALADGTVDRVAGLRDRFEASLLREFGEGPDAVRCNGARAPRTANVAHMSFPRCLASDLLAALDEAGVECSKGSACMAGKQGSVSHVQRAMGFDDERASSSLRFSLSLFTTEAEIDEAVGTIVAVVKRMRR
jgi:cysteine desulfurase